MISLLIALLFAGPTAAEQPMVVRPLWMQRPSAEDVGRVTPPLDHPPAEIRVLMACRITVVSAVDWNSGVVRPCEASVPENL